MNAKNLNIKTISKEDMVEIFESLGQPKFRATQVYEWFHKHNATSYDQMTNIPKALRELLQETYPLESYEVVEKACSRDGSRKYVLKLADGAVVETVGIFAGDVEWGEGLDESAGQGDSRSKGAGQSSSRNEDARLTVCFSTQVGCPLKCTFCATGKQGFTRNLTSDEMLAQVIEVSRDFGHRVSNVVAMGQGEPFSNYDALLDALHRMNQDEGLGIGARHITVSTAGLVNEIYKFAEEPEQFRLAISLHAANQDKRNALMPKMSGQPLRKLKKALEYYENVKGRRVTLEYMLLQGVNDGADDLAQLIEFCRGLNVHINLLPFNAVEGVTYKPSDKSVMAEWLEELRRANIPVSIRRSKGSDIAGACGQLINKE